MIEAKDGAFEIGLVRALKNISEDDSSTCAVLAEDFGEYIYEYAAIWRASNRESELSDLIKAMKTIAGYLLMNSKENK